MNRISTRDLAAPEVDKLTQFAEYLAIEAGNAILPHFRTTLAVEDKGATKNSDWDPVTEGDRAAEQAIRTLIGKHYPDHSILGEEYGLTDTRSDFMWVLDPIDGTRAFVIGMPTWATLVGLYYQGQPLLGVMRQPFVEEMFVGNPNGAWADYRGQRRAIRASSKTNLAHAQVGTTAPHLYRDPASAAGLANIGARCQSMRYGGDAYFFALVGAGHLDIAMDCGLQIYDIAALIPIIEGAGGIIGGWDNPDAKRGGNIIAAANQSLYEEALGCFTPA